MRFRTQILGILPVALLAVACSSASSSSADDASPTTVAQVETRAAQAYSDPGTVYATYPSSYPGIASWNVSVAATNSVVYSGVDANGVAKAQFAVVLDTDGIMAGAGSRMSDEIIDSRAHVLDVLNQDVTTDDANGTTTTPGTSLSSSTKDGRSHVLRPDSAMGWLVNKACEVAGGAVGGVAGAAAGSAVGGVVGAGAGTLVGGPPGGVGGAIVGTVAGGRAGAVAGAAAGADGGSYACALVTKNCTHDFVTAIKGIGLVLGAGEMAQSGSQDAAGMAQQGAHMLCPGAAATTPSTPAAGSGNTGNSGNSGGTNGSGMTNVGGTTLVST